MIVFYTTANGDKASIHIDREVSEDRACYLARHRLTRAGEVGFKIYAVRPA
ncbi:hypothetical protein PBI_KRATIO_85 [Mycobacterium phage Kratio]|uniref:Uncharacterized protein n=2 Tax=Kratiovirus TaxID=2948788 RepID=A0A221J7B4_9CAUD|nr:hypothetical protein PBI_KRATIO_85 [Mycobacterium phage Kratio]AJK27414.1 hypothetical protein PBI_KRATIO_85 [Mycobacterium phage Kratio]ASM62591.1 hypothetical protein SEA_ALLEYCAT_85 [Mycobacterium phage AlleyCat]